MDTIVNSFWPTFIGISFAITLTPLIMLFLERKSEWFKRKNREWVFVGNQIYKIVLPLVFLSIPPAVIFIIRTPNYLSFASLVLLLLSAYLIRQRNALSVGIFFVLTWISVWGGEGGGHFQSQIFVHWDSYLILFLSGIAFVLLVVIAESNRLLKKPWNEVESFLAKNGRTNEIDKYRQSWEMINKAKPQP